MEKKFHRSFKDSIVLSVIGIIVFAITIHDGDKIGYLHFYLILTLLVSVFISFRKYAITNTDGLTLYYGPAYFRKSVFLSWSEISGIKMDSAEKSWMGSYGGEVWFQMKTTATVPALRVTLKQNLSFETQKEFINTIKKYLLPPDEGITDQGNEIILKKAPWGGFKRFRDHAYYLSGKTPALEKN